MFHQSDPPGAGSGDRLASVAARWVDDPADVVVVALVHSPQCPGWYLAGPCSCSPRIEWLTVTTASDARADDDES